MNNFAYIDIVSEYFFWIQYVIGPLFHEYVSLNKYGAITVYNNIF